jgi:hypothetical protein
MRFPLPDCKRNQKKNASIFADRVRGDAGKKKWNGCLLALHELGGQEMARHV